MVSLVDVSRIASHLAARIRAADDQRLPAPFVFVEGALPAEVYDCIHGVFDKTSGALKEQIHRGDPKVFFGSYRDRLEARIPEELSEIEPEASSFWGSLYSAFTSPLLLEALIAKFEDGFRERFGPDAETAVLAPRLKPSMLVTRHRPNYFLGPHTDRFEKVITFILHCPERDGLEHLGTAIYEPKEAGFTCRGIVHHNPALFRRTHVVPFVPNSALVFFRGDQLFHGVEPLTETSLQGSHRANVQFNLWDR